MGGPLIVMLVPVVPLIDNPPGSAPELMDQLKGATPLEAVHVVEYGVPTTDGPVAGTQFSVVADITALPPVSMSARASLCKTVLIAADQSWACRD